MKTIEVEKTFKETWYEAVDGKQFKSQEECSKYENSAKCVLWTKYKPLVCNTVIENDLFYGNGSEEYTYNVVKLTCEKDVDTIVQLYALYHDSEYYKKYYDEVRQTCIKALQENDYLFIGVESCGDTFFSKPISRNSLFNHINCICNEQSNETGVSKS